MSCKKYSLFSAGFTLLELSISILIIALLMGSVVTIDHQKQKTAEREDMARKLDLISAALYNYRMVNNKLPCPGDSSLAKSDANFGLQADSAAEACNAGATISSNINSSGNDVFGGSVPVRTLGLADDVAFDPWGNAFTYYVDKEGTNLCNFTGNRGTAGFTSSGNLNVEDESGTAMTDTILAVVVSHGSNGHGAYNIAGQRVNASSSNAAEQENCMCDVNVAAVADVSRLIRIQRTLPTSALDFKTNFDDVGRYFNKAFFYTYAEKTK